MLGSVLGGIAGLLTGGTAMAAAVGAGLGRLAGGGDLEDALKDGALAFGIGSIPGVGNFAKSAAGQLGLGGATAKASTAKKMADAAATGAAKGGFSLMSPGGILTAASLAGMAEKKEPSQGPVFEKGERLPEYEGNVIVKPYYSPITNERYMTLEEKENAENSVGIMSAAAGGYIEGPGTGRSDDVKAGIFQNGQKVQEARLSDGEFVMTRKAVDNAGGGDREKGAAKMYALMNSLERGVA
jgi:hypothetical protein